MDCPSCGHPNIEGADECESCQQPLMDLSKPRPRSDLERRVLKDRIRVLNPRTPVSVAPETPVGDVLKLLAEKSMGCVLVMEDSGVAGIFSERDALMRLNTQSAALADRPVSEFMTPRVETLDMDDKIAFALHRMDLGGFRHIPVCDDGRVAGIISIRDILRHMTDGILAAE